MFCTQQYINNECIYLTMALVADSQINVYIQYKGAIGYFIVDYWTNLSVIEH